MVLGVSAFETFVLKILASPGKEKKGRRSKSLDNYHLAKGWLGAAWELSLDDILGDKRMRDLKFVLCWRHVIIHRADISYQELVDCARGAYGDAGVRKWVSDKPTAMDIAEAKGYVKTLRQSAYLIYDRLESYAKEGGTPDVPPPWPRVWIRDSSPDAAGPLHYRNGPCRSSSRLLDLPCRSRGGLRRPEGIPRDLGRRR